MIYWKTNLKWTLKTFATEQARRTRKKKKISLPTVAQFSFYKDETNILQNCKKLKTQKFPSLRTFLDRQLPSTRKNDKKFFSIDRL